jgi:hypothetical protein
MLGGARAAFSRAFASPEFWADVREKGSLFVRVACLVHVVRTYGVEATAVRADVLHLCSRSRALIRQDIMLHVGPCSACRHKNANGTADRRRCPRFTKQHRYISCVAARRSVLGRACCRPSMRAAICFCRSGCRCTQSGSKWVSLASAHEDFCPRCPAEVAGCKLSQPKSTPHCMRRTAPTCRMVRRCRGCSGGVQPAEPATRRVQARAGVAGG